MWGRRKTRRARRTEAQATPAMAPIVERDHARNEWVALDERSGRVLARHASLAVVCEMVSGDDGTRQVLGHNSLDTQIAHCVFCGSGDVFARSDGTTECMLCGRSFFASEQPLYAAAPSPQYMGQEIGGEPPSPAPAPSPAAAPIAAPAFVPPADAATDAPDPAEQAPVTAGLRTEAGAVLDEDAYVAHLAYKYLG